MAFKRGDGVLFTKTSTTSYVDRASETRVDIEFGVVTSITRDGVIKKFIPARAGIEIAPERLGFTGKNYRLAQENWDVEGAMEYCLNRPWPHDDRYRCAPFDSVEQAREELAQFRKRGAA